MQFRGSEELEKLWSEHIGSRHMFMSDELVRLRDLKASRKVDWRTVYRMYLTSKWWVMMRRKVLRRDGYRCTECASRGNLHVDHLRYPGFGRETLADLKTLCYKCHAKVSHRFDVEAHCTVRPRRVKIAAGRPLFVAVRGV